jgi:hypothetical protein
VTRGLVGLLVVALAVLATSCQARFDLAAAVDREGQGDVSLRLALDEAAQGALGFAPDADPRELALRFEPLLVEGGWIGDDAGPISAARDGRTGEVVLTTRHLVDSPRQLTAVLSERRPIAGLAPDEASLAALPGLPPDAPLLEDVTFRLGEETGDNPGFLLFARGGVGEIDGETCRGDTVEGFGRSLRDALQISYRFRLPGGPGATNANETPSGDNLWVLRFQDCPALRAESGGGSSSTVVNGAILGILGGLLVVIFAVRAVRRRRARAA